jgi:leader peptidase (prepilin peptidase)/N-methyltransferase
MTALVLVVAFLFGLIVGSFANVLLVRLPRGESIVYPGSHCPSCDAPVRPYDNLPVVSWLALRGQCRDCGWRIPARYPLVELAGGLIAVAIAALVLALV